MIPGFHRRQVDREAQRLERLALLTVKTKSTNYRSATDAVLLLRPIHKMLDLRFAPRTPRQAGAKALLV
jgi:hypothetical protein